MNKYLSTILLCLCTVSSGSALASTCRYSAQRSAQIPAQTAQGVKRVVIRAGAGNLKILGEQGRSAVDAAGNACASSEKLMEAIQISSKREGDTVYIETQIPETSGTTFLFSLFGDYAHLDLTVRVPRDLPLDITDSSGDMEVRDVHSAIINDSSGDTSVNSVDGDLTLNDSSGDIDIQHVDGNLRVTDTSGDIEIRAVKGDVFIPVDTSGDIDIVDVGGSVHIEQDTSGDIDVSNVKKDVIIDADTSGKIEVDNVGGDFRVGAKSSGQIHHHRVGGQVSVPSKFR